VLRWRPPSPWTWRHVVWRFGEMSCIHLQNISTLQVKQVIFFWNFSTFLPGNNMLRPRKKTLVLPTDVEASNPIQKWTSDILDNRIVPHLYDLWLRLRVCLRNLPRILRYFWVNLLTIINHRKEIMKRRVKTLKKCWLISVEYVPCKPRFQYRVEKYLNSILSWQILISLSHPPS